MSPRGATRRGGPEKPERGSHTPVAATLWLGQNIGPMPAREAGGARERIRFTATGRQTLSRTGLDPAGGGTTPQGDVQPNLRGLFDFR